MSKNQDFLESIRNGWGFTPEYAETLEEILGLDSDQANLRLNLLGFYCRHQFCCTRYSQNRANHLLWFIERFPNLQPNCISYFALLPNDSSYSIIKAAWEKAIANEPGNPIVLLNMAYFMEFSEPQNAESFFERAVEAAKNKSSYERTLADFRLFLPELKKQVGHLKQVLGNTPCILSPQNTYE